VALVGLGASARDDTSNWKEYSDSNHGFLIHYPNITDPLLLRDKEPALLFRVVFDFEQPFHVDANVGSMRFRFQISAWQNPNRLTADTWARLNSKSRLPLEIHPIKVAGRDGVTFRTTTLAWPVIFIFVPQNDLIYELRYTDISSNQSLPSDVRARWSTIFRKMAGSFSFRP